MSALDASILEQLAVGASSVRIADRVHLSRQAVDYHITHMLKALSAMNRAGLISKAYALRILAPDSWPPKVSAELVR